MANNMANAEGAADSMANDMANVDSQKDNMANTNPDGSATYKYRDALKRREYQREYMRKRRLGGNS